MQIKTNCEVILKLKAVLEKYNIEISASKLLSEFEKLADTDSLTEAITLIRRVVECGD